MENQFGILGKILWVNLSTQEFSEENPDNEVYRSYLGGYGLGVYYIYNRIKPKSDPLGPDNILGFCPGLFTGSVAPFTGRWMVCGKSPLTGKGPTVTGEMCTGGWGDANAGGYFGPSIKRAGYDAIFFTGISESPVYLYIDKDVKELRDASDLWGKDCNETEEQLKERHGKAFQVASIGKAGEKLSLISGIVNDGGRIAARSGLGAVMGSKKLKALCLNGPNKPVYNDNKKAGTLAKSYIDQLNSTKKSKIGNIIAKIGPGLGGLLRFFKLGLKSPIELLMISLYKQYGTTCSTAISAETGDMPIRNLSGVGYRDYPQKISRLFAGPAIEKYKVKPYGCFACPLHCGAILSIPELGIKETHRPEYETLGVFGGSILNEDMNLVYQANDYLNREGMDSISAGLIISFVMECVENQILKQEDFICESFPDGFLPLWKKSDYVLSLLKMMVNREGIGDILADGIWEASRKIGKGSVVFGMMANGQELPMHDARGMQGLALTYLADPTPGRHTAAGIDFASAGPINHLVKGLNFKNSKDPYQKGILQAREVQFHQAFNALGFCEFGLWMGKYPLLELIKAIFGWELKIEDIIQTGYRIQTLRQMFNAREGAIRNEAPKRIIGEPPLKYGPNKDVVVDVETMIKGYYSAMDFKEDGVPKEETLKKLNLNYCIADLPNCVGRPGPILNNSLSIKNTSIQSETVPPIQTTEPQLLVINLAGYFETKAMNQAIEFNFESTPTIIEILKKLNDTLEMQIFSGVSVKQNRITVMFNGQRVEVDQLSKMRVTQMDVITILQPLVGG
jgi:aldehyde:ferredoxin oxidoreductase